MDDEDTSPTPPPAEPASSPEATPPPPDPKPVQSGPIEQTSAGQATQSTDSPVDVPVIEDSATEPLTAHSAPNEPLPSEIEPLDPPAGPTGQATKSADSGQTTKSADSGQTTKSADSPVQNSASPVATPASQNIRDLRESALLKKQELKRRKLDKIMEILNTKTSVTNDEVEKLLHVSDATATRYLSVLEKDGKIKQVGKTGTGVVYTKI